MLILAWMVKCFGPQVKRTNSELHHAKLYPIDANLLSVQSGRKVDISSIFDTQLNPSPSLDRILERYENWELSSESLTFGNDTEDEEVVDRFLIDLYKHRIEIRRNGPKTVTDLLELSDMGRKNYSGQTFKFEGKHPVSLHLADVPSDDKT